MGRTYGSGKGIADSALPYKRTPPSWLKTSAAEVEERYVCELVLFLNRDHIRSI